MKFGSYYQAKIDPPRAWFLVGVLRSFEHLTFDRTLDKEESVFEFFVPQDTEKHFCELMDYFVKEGIVTGLEKKENRLTDPNEVV